MDTDQLKTRLEVRDAVEGMIKNLAPIVESSPATVTPAQDFNPLLERARRAFPSSEAIRDMARVEREGVTLFDLLTKLSIIDGAIKADFSARAVAAVSDHNERVRRQRGTWLGR